MNNNNAASAVYVSWVTVMVVGLRSNVHSLVAIGSLKKNDAYSLWMWFLQDRCPYLTSASGESYGFSSKANNSPALMLFSGVRTTSRYSRRTQSRMAERISLEFHTWSISQRMTLTIKTCLPLHIVPASQNSSAVGDGRIRGVCRIYNVVRHNQLISTAGSQPRVIGRFSEE